MAQYASSKHVPQPELAVTETGAALVRGGASILLGVKPKLGASVLIGFLAGVSPIMHDFWREQDPNKSMEDMIQFTKNMAPGRYDGIHGCRRAVARERADGSTQQTGTDPKVRPQREVCA